MAGQRISAGDSNGGGAAVEAPSIKITVKDAATGTLNVEGTFPTLDYGINMLQQALRELEVQWRLQRAATHQQQLMENARVASILSNAKGRG